MGGLGQIRKRHDRAPAPKPLELSPPVERDFDARDVLVRGIAEWRFLKLNGRISAKPVIGGKPTVHRAENEIGHSFGERAAGIVVTDRVCERGKPEGSRREKTTHWCTSARQM